jgi:N,N-dimethylformamidase
MALDRPIAFVSDEHYQALPDVAVELETADGCAASTRSSAGGAVYADVSAGDYSVTLSKAGYGAKRVRVALDQKSPVHFRLLSDSFYGYAWPKWVKGGETAEFRVHSPEAYHLSLWRYGATKEQVRAIGWVDEHGPRANVQVLPDGDFSQRGVDWNGRGFSRKVLSTVAPEQSGLYFFHAETASGKFLSFPWVVAPAKPSAKLAVIASTNTWNAYNNFGGRSNYINPTGLGPRPTVNARLELSRYAGAPSGVWGARNDEYVPLSFDRPEPFNHVPKDVELTDPIRGRQACHLAETEWRMLGWIEREGFLCDLYSDYQLHSGALDLDAYQVLMISTHPEYWSRQAYFRVKQWVFERGGKLMYLGGNGLDCEIEFTDNSTMRCKSWQPRTKGSVQFTDPDTGKEFDCRFHYTVESPAALLGIVFTEHGCMTSAPYCAVDAAHWIFSGTGLKNGDLFGTESLHERCPGGASGHETDKRSAASPAGATVLARGTNPQNGGAELVCFDTASGGAVFSVGSITWPASVLADQNVSRITRNVMERFLK